MIATESTAANTFHTSTDVILFPFYPACRKREELEGESKGWDCWGYTDNNQLSKT
jgi:hypothetical protein